MPSDFTSSDLETDAPQGHVPPRPARRKRLSVADKQALVNEADAAAQNYISRAVGVAMASVARAYMMAFLRCPTCGKKLTHKEAKRA